MQPIDTRVVDALNDALTTELTVTNTYFLSAKMLEDWGLGRLGKQFYDYSIGEMKDAEEIIERILLLDGHPNVQRLNPIRIGESPKEMLELALESEKAAIAQFNEAVALCREVNDNGSRAFFEELVKDEEEHADWFETQLEAIAQVGLEVYLAEQLSRGDG